MKMFVAMAGLVALASAAQAQDAADAPTMDKIFPQVIGSLRNTLIDPNSMTNVMVCPEPVKIRYRDGKPFAWTFYLSVNSKNRMGGYAGATAFAAVVSVDKPLWVFDTHMPLDDKRLGACKHVPDAQVQAALQAE